MPNQYTEKEKQILRTYYSRVGNDRLASFFGRSRSSIKSKAHKMGLSKEPHHDVLTRARRAEKPEVNPLEAARICGVVAAEGSFHINEGNRYRFAVGMADRDLSILERMRTGFGVGHISEHEYPKSDNGDGYQYRVTSHGEIIGVVIPFFEEYDLRDPYKKRCYEEWRDEVLSYFSLSPSDLPLEEAELPD